MHLTKSYGFMRRDFSGDLTCEHCGHIDEGVSCYDDSNFHQNVIPNMKCSECDESANSKCGVVPVQTGPRQPDSVVM